MTARTGTSAWKGWLRAAAVVVLCTGLAELLHKRADLADIITIYLAGVVYVALREDTAVSVATVFVAIFLFDLVHVPPRWGLNPDHPPHLLTLGVMLAVGLLISRLAARAREHERKSREAEVAAETERLRSTLLSGISHDFRTPLTTIIGAATSLREQGSRLDARQQDMLVANILGEARRLHERVSHLLDLTRMQEGGAQLSCEWCPADDMVAEALQALGERTKSHELRIDVAGNAIVWCDPRLVELALGNLVDNAIRYSPPGGRVAIGVRVMGAQWELAVSDDGPGLEPGTEHEVFTRYHRGRSQPAGTGFGLGLAICAAVARLHGGSITAANAGGAKFTLRFPQPAREPLSEAAA